jgi:hypothetical protein
VRKLFVIDLGGGRLNKILLLVFCVALSCLAAAQEDDEDYLRIKKRAAMVAALTTPGIVSVNNGSNTGTTAVGTLADNTCATNAYCTQLPDASLAGNAIVVFETYGKATSAAPTISDDKANSYAACGSEAHDATNNRWAGVFYKLNAATGTRAITVTWSSTVDHGSAIAVQLYNVNAFDVCNANANTSAVTTYTSGSVTPSVSGDQFLQVACATNAFPGTGTITAGSGQANITWGLEAVGKDSGCALQSGVYSSTSALNPQMTTSVGTAYVSVGIAFKAASQGTAPSGFYIARMSAFSSGTNGTGPFTFQFPSTGNLIVVATQCGSTMTLSSLSDGTNTYVATSPTVGVSATGFGKTLYAANATSNRNLAITATTAGTGDCSFWQYDIAGAATAPLVGHLDDCVGTSSTSSDTNGDYCNTASTTGAVASFTSLALYVPGSTNSLTIGTIGVEFNTVTSATAPSSVAFDSNTVGAENISGPFPVDENNGRAHVFTTTNATQSWTWGVTRSALDVGLWNAMADSFAGSGATKKVSHIGSHACFATTAGTSLTCGYTPHSTSNMIALGVSTTATTGTISVSDSASNTINTNIAATTASGVGRMALFSFIPNGTSSDTFTITFGTSSTLREIYIEEMQGVTTFDVGDISLRTASGGVSTSAAVTTTAADEYLFSWILAGVTATPGTGFAFGRQDGSHGQFSEWQILTTSGSKTSSFASSSSTDGIGIGTFK